MLAAAILRIAFGDKAPRLGQGCSLRPEMPPKHARGPFTTLRPRMREIVDNARSETAGHYVASSLARGTVRAAGWAPTRLSTTEAAVVNMR
jgi:hypothetical protein